MKKENAFQAEVIRDVRKRIPNCIVLKTDANYLQGFPDLLIAGPNHWYAALECKRCEKAPHQPNQDYYVDLVNRNAIARFIYPENKEEVLDELQRSFETCRKARVSESE